jgi:hypothetical protein
MLTACAPGPEMRVPEAYKESLSLEEITAEAGKDIDLLKAITDIEITRNNELYDFVSASVLVKKPGWIHMRMYKFGMLIKDIVIKDENVYIKSGKDSPGLRQLAAEFYRAIFWWDNLSEGAMYSAEGRYIIRTDKKEIHLNRGTLLPLKQIFHIRDQDILLTYEHPVENNGYWYNSRMHLYAGEFTFSVTLKKVIKNPVLNEFDFLTPS